MPLLLVREDVVRTERKHSERVLFTGSPTSPSLDNPNRIGRYSRTARRRGRDIRSGPSHECGAAAIRKRRFDERSGVDEGVNVLNSVCRVAADPRLVRR